MPSALAGPLCSPHTTGSTEVGGVHTISPCVASASSLVDSGSDCRQYIRPLEASVDAGPDDIRSQEPCRFPGVRATARAIRLFLRRSDLFPSATTLWQSWRVVPPQSRQRATGVRSTSGRDHLRPRGSIFCAVGEDRPGDARMLGGQRNSGDIHMPTLLQSSRPGTLGVRLLVDDA